MKDLTIDPILYKEAENILDALGLPMDTAVTLFLRQVVLRGGLPFSVTLPEKQSTADTQEIIPEQESFGWMGELFEELLKETESVKAECEQDSEI